MKIEEHVRFFSVCLGTFIGVAIGSVLVNLVLDKVDRIGPTITGSLFTAMLIHLGFYLAPPILKLFGIDTPTFEETNETSNL